VINRPWRFRARAHQPTKHFGLPPQLSAATALTIDVPPNMARTNVDLPVILLVVPIALKVPKPKAHPNHFLHPGKNHA
jgi:hypothetical protein